MSQSPSHMSPDRFPEGPVYLELSHVGFLPASDRLRLSRARFSDLCDPGPPVFCARAPRRVFPCHSVTLSHVSGMGGNSQQELQR